MKQPQQINCTPQTRRSFDDEFKRQSVALTESGRPVRHLARELEVTASMLCAWKRKSGSSLNPSTPASSDLGFLQEKDLSLRAVFARLRQREEILKNARHPLRTKAERFLRIEAMKADYPIAQLCMGLGFSAAVSTRGASRGGGRQGAMTEVLCAAISAPFSRVRRDMGELSACCTPSLGKDRSGFDDSARVGSRGTPSLRNLQRPAAVIIGKRSFGALRPLRLS